MRKFFIAFLLPLVGILFFTSCADDGENSGNAIPYVTIDFEDVTLHADSTLKDTSFISKNMTFVNVVNSWGFWSGFAASSRYDMTTAGYTNDLSVYAPTAASGKKYAVVYDNNAVCYFADNKEYVLQELKLNNSTYAYLSMKDGDAYAKKFASGDWFKLTIYGYNSSNVKVDSLDYYLADFRDGKSYICNQWTIVPLGELGLVNKLSFSFSSSDNGAWGMNTPAYVCVDDIKYILPQD